MNNITYTQLAVNVLLKKFVQQKSNEGLHWIELLDIFSKYCEEHCIVCCVTSAVMRAVQRLMYLGIIEKKSIGLYVKK